MATEPSSNRQRNTSASGSGGDLVRHLLFPCFADAGSNDAFLTQPTTRNDQGDDHNNDDDDDAASEASTTILDNRTVAHHNKIRQHGSDTTSITIITTDDSHVVASEATTNDNRTPRTAVRHGRHHNSPRSHHRLAVDTTTTTRPTTTAAAVMVPPPTPRSRPPPFFASTRPVTRTTSSTVTASVSAASVSAVSPPLPPTVSLVSSVAVPPPVPPVVPPTPTRAEQFARTPRSLSTVAMAGGEAIHELLLHTYNDNDEPDDLHTVAIHGVAHSTTTSSSPWKDASSTNNNDDDNDMDTTTRAGVDEELTVALDAAGGSSPLSTLEQQREKKNKSRLSNKLNGDCNDQEQSQGAVWEEEATPAQTAFAKELYFSRKNLDASPSSSGGGALSTASEMGTVVDYVDRIADLDADISAAAAAVDHLNKDEQQQHHHHHLNNSLLNSSTTVQIDLMSPPSSTSAWIGKSSSTSSGADRHAAAATSTSFPLDQDDDLTLPELLEYHGGTQQQKQQQQPRATRTNHDHDTVDDEKKFADDQDGGGEPHKEWQPPQPTNATDEEEVAAATSMTLAMTADHPQKEKMVTSGSSNKDRAGASTILSRTLQRIGSGLTGNHKSISAPNTPRISFSLDVPLSPVSQRHNNNNTTGAFSSPLRRSTEDRSGAFASPVRWYATEKGDTSSFVEHNHHHHHSSAPSSFLLRSPGSAAFEAASSSAGKRTSLISPRFTSRRRGDFLRNSSVSRIDEDKEDGMRQQQQQQHQQQHQHQPNARNKSAALMFARSCFSFDAYDTTTDEEFHLPMSSNNNHAPFLQLSKKRSSPQSSSSTSSVRWPGGEEDEEEVDQPGRKGHQILRPRMSLSWDIGGSSRAASAFRPAPFRRTGDNNNSNRNSEYGLAVTTTTTTTTTGTYHSPQRHRAPILMSGFGSPAGRPDAMELKSPERIDMEREDALDILSCLVERGITFKQQDASSSSTTPSPDFSTDPSLVTGTVELLKELSRADATDDSTKGDEPHRQRLEVIDELVRSHEYALEMRRASQSALAWLKSIGRSASTGTEEKLEILAGGGLKSSEQVPAGNEAIYSSTAIDLLTTKAMLHTAQIELKEKAELADRMNEELAQCRAEIGRLRSAAQGSLFRSPNRSILDNSDEFSVPETDVEGDRSFESSSPIMGVDESGFLGSSFLVKPDQVDNDDNNDGGGGAAAAYRTALEQANEQIRKLHSMLRESAGETVNQVEEKAPIVSIPVVKEQPQPIMRPSNTTEENTDSVRMLDDDENFTTDWNDLSDLPPPPDHGLRSPIVEAVLEQWSNSPELHDSLFNWMDLILSGGDPTAIPPLTLSNLDHQVRDGFVMHVLPLLLRRPGIRVDVKTRVHRVTTYDLAVTVGPAQGQRTYEPLDVRRHLETTSAQSDVGGGSTTYSTATELISNSVGAARFIPSSRSFPDGGGEYIYEDSGRAAHTPHHHIAAAASSSRLSYDEMAESGIGVEPSHRIMSALGGALGGLLTRRKPGLSSGHVPSSPSHHHSHRESSPYETAIAANTTAAAVEALAEQQQQQQQQSSSSAAASLSGSTSTAAAAAAHGRVFLDEGSAAHSSDDHGDQQQPYHRVVSAPPGRIGVTFVEYRGHAMVSDVAADSPLASWVFPSDILIAIDELPVSGLRVRDIIKVLKDRSGRQRALRVISSFAMNEFTLNSSALLLDGPS